MLQVAAGIRDIGVLGVERCALQLWLVGGDLRAWHRSWTDFTGRLEVISTCVGLVPTIARLWPLTGKLPDCRYSELIATVMVDRKSVVEGKRGDLAGRRISKKK